MNTTIMERIKSTLFFCLFVLIITCIQCIDTTSDINYYVIDKCDWTETGLKHKQKISSNRLKCELKLSDINDNYRTNRKPFGIQSNDIVTLETICNQTNFYSAQQPHLIEGNIPSGFFQSLTDLQQLMIDHCSLSKLTSQTFHGLRQLTNLTIRSYIEDLSSLTRSVDVKGDTFKELVHLDTLDLSTNLMLAVANGLLCPLKELRHLNLSVNRIQDLVPLHFSAAISTIPSKQCGNNLQILDLAWNNINNLPAAIFSNLKRLIYLNLNNNGMNFITDRALEGLVSLKVIHLSYNNLNSLPPELFDEAKSTSEIYLDENQLRALAPDVFNKLQDLTVLNLAHNELTSDWINYKTFKGLHRLTTLNLAHNKIRTLERNLFKDLNQLSYLHLENNAIETISDNLFMAQKNLNTLTLSYNRITQIGGHTFNGLAQLNLLSIDFNQIDKIHTNAFKITKHLQDLYLNGNKLKRVPDALRSLNQLNTLDLGENHITLLQNNSFLNLTNLYGLRISDNQIEQIQRQHFIHLNRLKWINLSRNKIYSIDLAAFKNNGNLQAIRLDTNYISNISTIFTKLDQLLVLNISNNRIREFDYSSIPSSLQWLDMHANDLNELYHMDDLDRDISLTTFDLSENKLNQLSGKVIPASIEKLYLNNNQIKTIQSYTFFKKPNLTVVDLSQNQIEHLEPNMFRISTVPDNQPMPSFHMKKNPLVCDCNIKWLQQNNETVRTQPILADLNEIQCQLLFSRSKIGFTTLIDVTAMEFLCEYQTHCFKLCNCCDYLACDCKMHCPEHCGCYHSINWSTNIVDCSGRNYLNELPKQIPIEVTELYLDGNEFNQLPSHSFIGRKNLKLLLLNNSQIHVIQNHTFNGLMNLELLHLDNNLLREFNGVEFDGLTNLKKLYLQNNQIERIADITFLTIKKLKFLQLAGNRLKSIEFLLVSNQLSDIRLFDNPFVQCDCKTMMVLVKIYLKENLLIDHICEHFQSIIENIEYGQSLDSIEVCNKINGINDNDTNSFNLNNGNVMNTGVNGTENKSDKHKILITHKISNSHITSLITIIILTFVLIVFILIIFIFREDIYLWFYAKLRIRLFNQYNEIDKYDIDKIYDMFVFYSTKNDIFVQTELIERLENATTVPYKLCLYHRDCPASSNYRFETILYNIKLSKRICIIFSNSFIEHEWCKYEIRSLLHQMLYQYRKRLILIEMKDFHLNTIDPDLNLYIKANNRIKENDRLFYKKLQYFLPTKLNCDDEFINVRESGIALVLNADQQNNLSGKPNNSNECENEEIMMQTIRNSS